MGTRGSFGVHVDGETKATYNHYDSYPSCLGEAIASQMVNLLKDMGVNKLKEQARNLRMVDPDSTPTDEDKEFLKAYTDLSVSEQSDDDWYCVTRDLQGHLDEIIRLGVMLEGGTSFLNDSLFCEWAYIVNLDTMKLEVYKGFQTEPHEQGRYGAANKEGRKAGGGSTYYPVALIAEFDLNSLDPAEVVKLERADEDEE